MAKQLFPGFDAADGGQDGPAALLRALFALDWAASSAGPVAGWPPELRVVVATVLRAAAPMAVLVGRDGVLVCNEAARAMLGDAHVGAQGRPIAEVLPVAAAFYRDALDACAAGRSLSFRDEPIRLRRAGALRTCWFSFSMTPIFAANGVCAALLTGSDTTEHMHMRKAVSMSHKHAATALEADDLVSMWNFDVANCRFITDSSLIRQYVAAESLVESGSEEAGLGSILPLETLVGFLHADDRAQVAGAMQNAISSGADCRVRFRAMKLDGTVRWYVAIGRSIRDGQQRVVELTGVLLDVTEQAETAAALKQSNLRFDTLTEAIPQIVWSADANGTHDFFNRRWTEFTGIDHRVVAPDMWKELLHPDDRERVMATWGDCLATGKTYDIDYRYLHHDGEFRWLRVIAMPMQDEDGRIVRWYGTSTDIHEAKQLDAQKELVTRELDHRIKNLFALVGGLVGLSVREEPSLAPLAGRLRARLEALHRAHSLIRGGGGTEAGSLRCLLEQLLDPYRTAEAGHIVIEGEDATLQTSAVTSAALILHELATNAAKYGALAQADGRLSIALRRSGDWQAIVWTERFPAPRAAASPTGGFGSRLLESIVERQFGGRFARTLDATGLSVVIELPAAILSDRGATPQR